MFVSGGSAEPLAALVPFWVCWATVSISCCPPQDLLCEERLITDPLARPSNKIPSWHKPRSGLRLLTLVILVV